MVNTHFIHVLENTSDSVMLTGVPDTIKQARLLHSGAAVEMERQDDKLLMFMPEDQRDPSDTVIVLS
jgi:hypothetical protein